jgi:hypothetical protein
MGGLTNIIEVNQAKGKEITGLVASEFYQLYDDAQQWVWACDVDIGKENVLRKVPVATNNRDVLYAEIGKAVTLKRLGKAKYAITGLAKNSISTKKYTFVRFEEDLWEITGTETVGYTYRRLTYDELGSIPGKYGIFPYTALGKFDHEGNFVELVG